MKQYSAYACVSRGSPPHTSLAHCIPHDEYISHEDDDTPSLDFHMKTLTHIDHMKSINSTS